MTEIHENAFIIYNTAVFCKILLIRGIRERENQALS